MNPERAAVVMVRLVGVALVLGVKLAGLKRQLASAGNPEHAKVIELENDPCGITVTVILVELPADTVAVPGEEDNAKSGALMVWLNTAEVLAALFVSPLYIAAIECCPTDKVEVPNVATPELFSAPIPSVVEPSTNVTTPVGVFGPVVVTVAVKVTVEPATAGFALEANAVVVV